MYRYKARLVIQRFRQQKGVDYEEIFTPIAKMTTVRTILLVTAIKNGVHVKWMLLLPSYIVTLKRKST